MKLVHLFTKQVFSRKLEEVGRVLFLISLTQHMPAVHRQSHVSLLQEDLLRLPSFPRTAIDAEFSLFNEPQGKNIYPTKVAIETKTSNALDKPSCSLLLSPRERAVWPGHIAQGAVDQAAGGDVPWHAQ